MKLIITCLFVLFLCVGIVASVQQFHGGMSAPITYITRNISVKNYTSEIPVKNISVNSSCGSHYSNGYVRVIINYTKPKPIQNNTNYTRPPVTNTTRPPVVNTTKPPVVNNTIPPVTNYTHNSSISEQIIFEKVNEERVKVGLNELSFMNDLSTLAKAHSEDMILRNFFSHVNPDGEDPTARAKRMGIRYITDHGSYRTIGIAENIAMVPLGNIVGCGKVSDGESLALCAMNLWMNSPGHKANILNTGYSEIGVGVACDSSKCMLTQDFR